MRTTEKLYLSKIKTDFGDVMGLNMKCPVCGNEKKSLSVSKYDCDVCGFKNAYIRCFATVSDYNNWKQGVKKAETEWKIKRKSHMISSVRFWIGNSTIAYLNYDQRNISIVLGNGSIQNENNVISFSSSERNYALLYDNGTVRVFGDDNSFGQKKTDEWRGIKCVLTAPNCTYGVTETGQILFAGSLCNPKIKKWNNIKLLKVSNDNLIGLNYEGKILMENDYDSYNCLKDATAWSGIVDIAVSRDSIIGLTDEGKVLFSGKKNDSRKHVEDWRNIIAIALDNAYAYGLSREGKIYLAGSSKAFLDRGRSRSSQWNSIISISCNNAGIGAVNESGDLLFAGTITGDITKMLKTWDSSIKDRIASIE